MRKIFAPLSFLALAACGTQTPTETPLADTLPPPQVSEATAEDPYLWLEEVEGEAALDWVRNQNDRSLKELKADPDYAGYEAAAIEALTSAERIPYGSIRDGMVYNFWQDETHVRGLWRRTTLESYASDTPEWETILDFDKLAEEEGKNWVYKGADCFRPKGSDIGYKCMISLSNGGKDAIVRREFDLATKQFVDDGFVTPEAKQGGAWASPDTLLIATDWGEETLTASGYPFIVKRWDRGTPLDAAEEVIRGEGDDVGVWPMTLELEDGRILQGAAQADTFFTTRYWWFPNGESEPVQWPIPPKSSPEGIHEGRLLVSLKQDWTPTGQETTFKSGDLVAFDVETFMETRALPPVSLVFHPSETQALKGVSTAKGALLLGVGDTAVGKVMRATASDAGWMLEPISLPGTGQASVAFASDEEDTVFINYEDFLTPDSLLSYSASTGDVKTLKSLPPKFDATGLSVTQHFATSKDGTRVPYFLVSKADLPLDGSTPTLLYGYGG
ncbi:MAG TPA: S9 family peptidase, partial [Hyphomonas sp.]|nr:S9 family peptidase [Hyphomonas sp.]HBT34787.1 S9 family peptidase [Hyphomonas sp.]